jgi:GNAT superfamily N-acetyltransferase
MDLRQLGAGDEDVLRDVRLRALGEARYAFDSALEREADLGFEFWRQRVSESAAGLVGAIFAAIDEDGHPIGMAGGYLGEGAPERVTLWGVWVDPGARDRGLGRELVQAVVDWARGTGARELSLCVTDSPQSHPAAALYRRLGFREDGHSEPLDSDPSLTALGMSLDLRQGEALR